MPDDSLPQRLATIMSIDVAGYSELTEADAAHTAVEVAALRRKIEALATREQGRVFNTAGDGFMLEFPSASNALALADTLCESEALPLRIGVHLADVFVTQNGDLLGHGVNIAARLQQQAEPGGALISIDVRRALRGAIVDKLRPKGLLKLDKMAETIEAFALIGARHANGAHKAHKEPLLAVLPFDNYSADPETQFFSDGVSDEILEAVSRVPGLKVIGRTSSFQFRGERKVHAAGILHATHLLDGTVRRAGTRMRVHAQLTEASSGTLLWGEKYDSDIADAFTVQDSIAAQVAVALQTALPRHKRAPAKIDHVAYELYLRARPLVKELAEDDARRAEPMLQQAIARAPDFAQAWAALAMTRSLLLPRNSDAIGDPGHEAAMAAANRALALDPDCADALVALAVLKPAFAEHGEKIQLTESAVALAPNDPLAAAACDGALISVGRVSDAMKHLEAAARLDPLSPLFVSSHAFHLRTVGRTEEAIAAIEDASQRFPDASWVWIRRWTIFFMSGRREEAERMCADGAPLPAGMTAKDTTILRFAHMLFAMPKPQREQALRALLDRDEALILQFCAFAAEADCADLAYEYVFKALDSGRPLAGQAYGGRGIGRAFRLSTLFSFVGAALRRDPRFAVFCARVGLADYWCESQNWPDCLAEVKGLYDFRAACEKAAARAAP
jgi:adenylate cyclase